MDCDWLAGASINNVEPSQASHFMGLTGRPGQHGIGLRAQSQPKILAIHYSTLHDD
jgi:hypothetical protein